MSEVLEGELLQGGVPHPEEIGTSYKLLKSFIVVEGEDDGYSMVFMIPRLLETNDAVRVVIFSIGFARRPPVE